MSAQTFVWMFGDQAIPVELSLSGDAGTARIGERDYAFRIVAWDANAGLIELDGRRYRFCWASQPPVIFLWLNGHYYQLKRQPSARDGAPQPSEAGGSVTAPMPGTVVQLFVKEGERVAAHQPLLVMESMKMESVLRAPRAGLVSKVDCKPGDVVEIGKVLIVLEA